MMPPVLVLDGEAGRILEQRRNALRRLFPLQERADIDGGEQGQNWVIETAGEEILSLFMRALDLAHEQGLRSLHVFFRTPDGRRIRGRVLA